MTQTDELNAAIVSQQKTIVILQAAIVTLNQRLKRYGLTVRKLMEGQDPEQVAAVARIFE